MKRIFVLLFVVLSFANAEKIVFGVVPQQSPLVMTKKWVPLIKELSEKSGLDIVFKTEASIPKFEKALYSGKYDIAYMNPYHFVIANKKQGFKALVRSSKLIQGILVSKSKDKIENLKSINGMSFLFPAPKAFAATLLTKYELKSKYNLDVDKDATVKYVNSHDSVYKGVSRDVGEYGGGIVRTYKNLVDKTTKDTISIVYKTDKYPSHPIGINSNISPKVEQKLIKALHSLSTDTLKRLNIPKVIDTTNSEYDVVKDLAIKLDIY